MSQFSKYLLKVFNFGLFKMFFNFLIIAKTADNLPMIERSPPPSQMSIDMAGEPTLLDIALGDTKMPEERCF